jgi:CMP-N,N'-diacetyllegionaminic acid synthase
VRTLGLIPARGGSKSVPRKNVRGLAGKPVLAWTVEVALASPALERVVVSTDDEEIADVARACGAEVLARPAELAQDETPDLPVYRHALARLDDAYDAVAWLRPTAPLRTPDDVEAAVRLLAETGADAVRSVCEAEHNPYWMARLEAGRLVPLLDDVPPRRQLLPPVYRLNGAVDVARCASVGNELFGGDVRAYVMPPERSVDLDTELDFLLAEALLRR